MSQLQETKRFCKWCGQPIVKTKNSVWRKFCNEKCSNQFYSLSNVLKRFYINDYDKLQIELLKLDYEGKNYKNKEIEESNVCQWCKTPIPFKDGRFRKQKYCCSECACAYRKIEGQIYRKYCFDSVRCSQELDKLFEQKKSYRMPIE
jgi:hypothetical protein